MPRGKGQWQGYAGQHGAKQRHQPQIHHSGAAAAAVGPKFCQGCRKMTPHWSLNQSKKADGLCKACIEIKQQNTGTVVQPLQRVSSHGDRFRAQREGHEMERAPSLGPLKDPRVKALFDLVCAADHRLVVRINDIFANKLDANRDGFLTYSDFLGCPGVWDYLLSMGFDNNQDLQISANEFGTKFIELALKEPFPVEPGCTGLELYEGFISALTAKVTKHVNEFEAWIDKVASAMRASSQEIARAAFEESAALAFRQTGHAPISRDQHHSVLGTFPGVSFH